MPFYKKNASKRKNGKKRLVRRKKQTKVSAPVKSYVNRLLSRSEETKFSTTEYTATLFNSGINSSGDLISVLPQVTVGTGQNNRIGLRIRPTKLEIRGFAVYYSSSDSLLDARMIGGRLFCFQDKTNRCYNNTGIENYNILNIGGLSGNFTGTIMNYLSPHNTEQFQWFADRKMVFMKPYGRTNQAAPTSTTAITGMDKSLFHPFTIVLTQKDLPAVLTYDNNESVQFPVNFAPKLAFGYCDMMAAAADTTNTQVQLQFSATLYYKDA